MQELHINSMASKLLNPNLLSLLSLLFFLILFHRVGFKNRKGNLIEALEESHRQTLSIFPSPLRFDCHKLDLFCRAQQKNLEFLFVASEAASLHPPGSMLKYIKKKKKKE